jgi:hypothetical protein
MQQTDQGTMLRIEPKMLGRGVVVREILRFSICITATDDWSRRVIAEFRPRQHFFAIGIRIHSTPISQHDLGWPPRRHQLT